MCFNVDLLCYRLADFLKLDSVNFEIFALLLSVSIWENICVCSRTQQLCKEFQSLLLLKGIVQCLFNKIWPTSFYFVFVISSWLLVIRGTTEHGTAERRKRKKKKKKQKKKKKTTTNKSLKEGLLPESCK